MSDRQLYTPESLDDQETRNELVSVLSTAHVHTVKVLKAKEYDARETIPVSMYMEESMTKTSVMMLTVKTLIMDSREAVRVSRGKPNIYLSSPFRMKGSLKKLMLMTYIGK